MAVCILVGVEYTRKHAKFFRQDSLRTVAEDFSFREAATEQKCSFL